MNVKTELTIIDDVLAGIEIVRPGTAVLAIWNPVAAATIQTGLTTLFEELSMLRSKLVTETDEEKLAELRKGIVEAAQNYAALRFGAMPDQGGGI